MELGVRLNATLDKLMVNTLQESLDNIKAWQDLQLTEGHAESIILAVARLNARLDNFQVYTNPQLIESELHMFKAWAGMIESQVAAIEENQRAMAEEIARAHRIASRIVEIHEERDSVEVAK